MTAAVPVLASVRLGAVSVSFLFFGVVALTAALPSTALAGSDYGAQYAQIDLLLDATDVRVPPQKVRKIGR